MSGPSSTTCCLGEGVFAKQSVWRSPIPYLFGGLAAMLGLIAIALIILVCSHCKRTASDGERRDAEKVGELIKVVPEVFDEKIVVIMAGDDNPTYLATPIFPSSKSFLFQREYLS